MKITFEQIFDKDSYLAIEDQVYPIIDRIAELFKHKKYITIHDILYSSLASHEKLWILTRNDLLNESIKIKWLCKIIDRAMKSAMFICKEEYLNEFNYLWKTKKLNSDIVFDYVKAVYLLLIGKDKCNAKRERLMYRAVVNAMEAVYCFTKLLKNEDNARCFVTNDLLRNTFATFVSEKACNTAQYVCHYIDKNNTLSNPYRYEELLQLDDLAKLLKEGE